MVKVLKHEDFVKLKRNSSSITNKEIDKMIERYRKDNEGKNYPFPQTLYDMIKCIDQRLANRNINLHDINLPNEAVAAIIDYKYNHGVIEMIQKHYKRHYGVYVTLTQYKKMDSTNRFMYTFRISRKKEYRYPNSYLED